MLISRRLALLWPTNCFLFLAWVLSFAVTQRVFVIWKKLVALTTVSTLPLAGIFIPFSASLSMRMNSQQVTPAQVLHTPIGVLWFDIGQQDWDLTLCMQKNLWMFNQLMCPVILGVRFNHLCRGNISCSVASCGGGGVKPQIRLRFLQTTCFIEALAPSVVALTLSRWDVPFPLRQHINLISCMYSFTEAHNWHLTASD